ncbi:MAG: SpoIIE family protein phosphatase [Leptonema sp. (in: Bacteria)]|nr:SpoIIE family protein phosphatase [Leptonema sp. (in: bacteria)]
MNKTFLFGFLLLLPVNLFAEPISLKNDWFAKDGFDITTPLTDESKWLKFDLLPITAAQIPIANPQTDDHSIKAKSIRTITLARNFNISNVDQDLSILLPHICNVYQIYLNGHKIDERGKLDIETGKVIQNGIIRGKVVVLPKQFFNENEPNQLRFVLQGYSNELIGLWHADGDNLLFLASVKENMYQSSERVPLMLTFLYLFVGLYHLLLFSKRPKELYNLYFGLLSTLIAIYNYSRSNAIYETGLDPYEILVRFEYISLFFIPVMAMLFFDDFFSTKRTKNTSLLTKIYFSFIAVISLLMLFVNRSISATILLTWQLSALIVLIYIGYKMFKALRSRNKDAYRLLIGFSFLVIVALWDILGAIPVWGLRNLGLMKYGFFIFIMGIAVVLANRFLRVHNQVEELNADLEKKVENRTIELQKTLTEVRDLKVQQDGDYFLTSLLIKPLGVNASKSDYVNVDFFVRQKKRFQFKNREVEIGGDLCIANTIQLKQKNYTVFLNGDAMGKSMQGAGGALVLGVVFKSIVVRTQMRKESQDLYPEQWLKQVFIELQDTFVSFDGSMLVSLVVGLVEDETGVLYYINAEHPWSVLYREKQAKFIENDLLLYKIGIAGLDGVLQIRTLQLQPRDVIILGSDGRDDILIGTDEAGQRIINEDETQFLRRVEEGNGQLEEIAATINRSGELTDDFTMLRIGYLEQGLLDESMPQSDRLVNLMNQGQSLLKSGDFQEAAKILQEAALIDDQIPELLRDLALSYRKIKEYSKAAYYSERYIELRPSDSRFLYLTSLSYKLSRERKKAIDYGERFRLRDPNNIKNLINLADSYRLLRKYEMAEKILSKIFEIDKSNSEAIKLRASLHDSITISQK